VKNPIQFIGAKLIRPDFSALLLNLENEGFVQTPAGVDSITIGCRVFPEK